MADRLRDLLSVTQQVQGKFQVYLDGISWQKPSVADFKYYLHCWRLSKLFLSKSKLLHTQASWATQVV
jgi:hypothetical protein